MTQSFLVTLSRFSQGPGTRICHICIPGIGLTLTCDGGSCGGISLISCKLVPVQYRDCEYGPIIWLLFLDRIRLVLIPLFTHFREREDCVTPQFLFQSFVTSKTKRPNNKLSLQTSVALARKCGSG